MSIKFFGQFLLERNAISAKNLLDAIRFQESRKLKFGEYAVSKGFISREDIDRLYNEQKHKDLMIGELAVQLGILTDEQVDEVLTMQKNDHVCIGEAIVAKGFLDKETISRELDAFKKEQSVYDLGEVHVPVGLKKPAFVKIMADVTQKMIRRFAGVEAKMDDGVLMEQEPEECFAAVSVTFSGGLNFEYVLLADTEVSRTLAGSVLGADASNEEEEVVVDGVREFANVICGNILAKMAQKGKNVEISIPHSVDFKDGYKFVMERKAVKYTIATTSGLLYLLIVEL
jgi:CheY-specific phosphatase CheX